MASATVLTSQAQDWIRWDPNPVTRRVLEEAVRSNDEATLNNLLSSRLEFGTAGLRGPMGAGANRMNDLVVIQTTQVDKNPSDAHRHPSSKV